MPYRHGIILLHTTTTTIHHFPTTLNYVRSHKSLNNNSHIAVIIMENN